MTERNDWADRFDQDLATMMMTRSESPEGDLFGGGLPGYLGIRFVEVAAGRVVAEVEVEDHLLNPFGAAHGAVLASLVDHVLGSAVFPIIPRGTWPATLEFKLNYLAPTRAGTLRATGRVVSMSTKTAVVAVECENNGRTVGTALGTIALAPPKPKDAPPPS